MIIVLIGIVFLVWSLLPYLKGTWHSGTFMALLIGLYDVLALFLYRFFVYRLLLVLMSAVIVVFSLLMIAACFKRCDDVHTIIVLGAHFTSETPSRIMKQRVAKAAAWLNAHPEGRAILSGGQTKDEPCTEAEQMQRMLVDAGIAKDRLILEKKSTTTVENFACSRAFVHEKATVVTSEFHMFRSLYTARKYGLEAYALPCRTPLIYLLIYWLREMAAFIMQQRQF